MTHSLARFDAAPYGVYRWAGEAAPTRHAAGQRPGDDGSGAVASRQGRHRTDKPASRPQRGGLLFRADCPWRNNREI